MKLANAIILPAFVFIMTCTYGQDPPLGRSSLGRPGGGELWRCARNRGRRSGLAVD